MLKHRFIASLIAILVSFSLVGQGTLVLAGTTGTLSGVVNNDVTGKGLAGVKVTATSPSQTASATTDGGGHFTILSLAPDTYTVSAELQGFQANSSPGVTIVSDNTREITLGLSKSLSTIGRVTARSAGNLVRPGTTADVYSINATQQAKLSAAGGGATQDSAFSALSTVPGVAVAPGQGGYIGAGATLSIRGGDYDQIGYQFDGIPINRSFDNYPSSATSSLGQQELQVYTGAPPPGTQSIGISGYINQVIKTGTNPGFANLDLGIGSPYYHKASFEFGGTALNNRFSYYVGAGGYNQDQRYVDNYDGASLANSYGYPLDSLGDVINCSSKGISQGIVPSCYNNGKLTPQGLVLGPYNSFSQSSVSDRDTVANFHYYFPHKDGTRDDIQLLFDNSALHTQLYSSANDLGGVGFWQNLNVIAGGTFAGNSNVSGTNAGFLTNGKPNTITYIDGYQLGLPTGGFLPTNYQKYASIYSFPNSNQHTFDDQINPGDREGFNNDQSIVKGQFTKSLGSSAFIRAYGYSYYSDWLISGENSAYIPLGASNGDYELESHSRGAGFTFQDQINSQNLLSINGDYSTAGVLRDNNTEYINGEYGPNTYNARTAVGVLVDSSNPTNGVCYNPTGAATSCFSSPTAYNGYVAPTATKPGNPTGTQFATLQQVYNGTVAPITAAACGGGPCQYLVVGNGQYATYNTVTPRFFGASINDTIRPFQKLTIDLGLRLDDYQFIGSDTSGGNARAFYYAAYNREMCESNTTQLLNSKSQLGIANNASCTTAGAFQNVNFTNPSGSVTQTYPEFQPRAGFTYSVTPTTVFRAAYGRYTQPPNTAFEQYNTLQANSPSTLYGTYGFQQYGFTTPNHNVPPAASNNYDFSIEQALPNQVSFKISPFLRKTQNQSQQFYLNRATNFVSGLAVGNQTSQGVEFELDKGDFSREGLSAKLSFAYTNSYIKYNNLSNGTTVLTSVVNGINAYNALTKAGGGARCYTLVTATGGGTADPNCGPTSIANPYYNAPMQDANAFSASQKYIPYDTIPAGIGVSADQYGYPYVASLALNEKVKRFSITPIVQLFAGARYGSPLATLGIDPTSCTAALGTSSVGDPRYKYGSTGGAAYDASSCGTLNGGIPNPESGAFDGLGAYSNPTQLLMHLQLNYDVSKNFSLTANLSNLVNTCFGGSKVPWAVAGACSYGVDYVGQSGDIGNTYNPGDAIQPQAQHAYAPVFNEQPFGVYVTGNLKL